MCFKKCILCLCNSCCGELAETAKTRYLISLHNPLTIPNSLDGKFYVSSCFFRCRFLFLIQNLLTKPWALNCSHLTLASLGALRKVLELPGRKGILLPATSAVPEHASTILHCGNWKHWDTRCSFKWKDIFRKWWEKPTKWLNTCMARDERAFLSRVASVTLLPQAEDRSCHPLSWGISIWPMLTLLNPSVWVRGQLLCLHAFPFQTYGLFLT